MAKKNLDWGLDGVKMPSAKDLYFDTSKLYERIIPNVNTPKITPIGSIMEGVEQKQETQIKIANEQNNELQKVNKKLQEQVELLVEQNNELKQQAEENEKQMKKQKWWNWITFLLSLGVAIASLIVAA